MTRAPKHDIPWTAAHLARLRWYASRGLSLNEAGRLLGRTEASVSIKASMEQIRFHGPPGAPLRNSNGVGTRFTSEHQPERKGRRPRGIAVTPREDDLCRACGYRVADIKEHFREVHAGGSHDRHRESRGADRADAGGDQRRDRQPA